MADWNFSVSVDPSTVAPGGTTTISVTATSPEAGEFLIDVEVYHQANGNWSKVHQQAWDNERFGNNQGRTFRSSFNVPGVLQPGPCEIKVGVFRPGWASLIKWVDRAGAFTIAGPSLALDVAGRVDPATARPGQPVSITASVTPSLATTVLVDIEVFQSTGGAWNKVHQQVWDNEGFQAGEGRTFTTGWTVPADAFRGEAEVKIGIFGPGWQGLALWRDKAAMIQIDGRQFNATGRIQITPERVGPGQSLQITAAMTPSLELATQVVLFAVNERGETVYHNQIDGQRLQAGTTWRTQVNWAGPYRDGQYSLGLAVLSADGGARYTQLNDLATLIVDHQAHHGALTISGSVHFQETVAAALDWLRGADQAAYRWLVEVRQGLGYSIIGPGVIELPIWALYHPDMLRSLLTRVVGGR